MLKAEPLFRCQSHYEGTLLVSIGTPDEKGRSLMNLVPIEPEGAIKLKLDDAHQVHRMWLDADQTRRLRRAATSPPSCARRNPAGSAAT